MTPHNFPPADQCTTEDLDAIADLVVSDPCASYDLAGSRDHIEALCRRYQALVQDLSVERETAAPLLPTIAALERELARATNDLDAARQAIADREDEIARVNNDRQREVNEATAQRERADDAETAAELFETIARAMWRILERRVQLDPPSIEEIVHAVDKGVARALVRERQVTERLTRQVESMAMLLDQQQATHTANDQIRSAFASAVPAICDGVTVEDLNHKLDAELAAHPEPGPLHHARDMRDQEDVP